MAKKKLKRVGKREAASKELEKKAVTISKAKGRPMLSWVGKQPLDNVVAFPAQKVEAFSQESSSDVQHTDYFQEWPTSFPQSGLLYHGDSKEALAHLLSRGFRGMVNLVYIDPPFDSGANYVRKIKLRGVAGAVKLIGETNTLGEQIQYSDIWANDNYLQFMYERLLLLKELLADGGAIFLHCDSTKGHFLRCLMDEVFGTGGFLNEIVWSYRRWPSNTDAFQAMHDTIFYYVKEIDKRHSFLRQYEEASESYLKRFNGKTQKLDEETGTRKITLDEETKGMPTRDVWEISILAGFKDERTGYPTQKPEVLLQRIIETCSKEGDLVLDCFVGSGTTPAVAQKWGRRWIGCDINKGAIQTTSKRLQGIINGQAESQQVELIKNEHKPPQPAQLSFAVYRVNDYDLQIQHNEAVAIACEHIGIQRTHKDSFFDGEYGKKLAKIIPFGHPISILDLEEVKRELRTRPGEDRDIVVVGLGKELAVDAWLDEWNRLRRRGDVPNKIGVIELRTDPKYGKFFKHEPAKARVTFSRKGRNIHVAIDNFISPSIVERLHQQKGVLEPIIDDWRCMVDCVMIDTNHNGEVFNVTYSDVPEKGNDLVLGRYELPVTLDKSTVAVKIVDMLGEEVIVVKEV